MCHQRRLPAEAHTRAARPVRNGTNNKQSGQGNDARTCIRQNLSKLISGNNGAFCGGAPHVCPLNDSGFPLVLNIATAPAAATATCTTINTFASAARRLSIISAAARPAQQYVKSTTQAATKVIIAAARVRKFGQVKVWADHNGWDPFWSCWVW